MSATTSSVGAQRTHISEPPTTGNEAPGTDLLIISYAIPFTRILRTAERVAEISLLHSDGNRGQAVRLGLNATVNQLLSTFVRSRYPSIDRVVMELELRDVNMVPTGTHTADVEFALQSLSPLFHDHCFVVVMDRASFLLSAPDATDEDVKRVHRRMLKGFARAAWNMERLYTLQKRDDLGEWGLGPDQLYFECVPELASGETALQL